MSESELPLDPETRPTESFERLSPILPSGKGASNGSAQKTRKCDACGQEFETPLPQYQRYCAACREARWAEDERSQRLETAQQAQSLRRRWMEIDSHIPARYWGATLETLVGRHPAGPKREAQGYAEVLARMGYQGGSSMVLCSHTMGTGKTHLAVAMCQFLMDYQLKEPPAWGPCPVLFVTAPNLFRRIRATYQDGAMETEARILAELEAVKLLVLDDVGRERPSQHTQDVYYLVINGRYNADRALLVTSNLAMPGDGGRLTELMGEASLSRLVEMVGPNWVYMEGKDYRRGGK